MQSWPIKPGHRASWPLFIVRSTDSLDTACCRRVQDSGYAVLLRALAAMLARMCKVDLVG